MLYEEFAACIKIENAPMPDATLAIEPAVDGLCLVNGNYPFPLETSSTLYAREEIFEIKDESDVRIGYLLTCAGQEFASLSSFGALHVSAYLFEVTAGLYGAPGRFRHDYILVDISRCQEYRRNFLESSAIWGGFEHSNVGAQMLPPPPASVQIVARRGIRLETAFHKEAAARSVAQPHAFERYLKLYHLLELSFELEIVNKIRSLGDDLNGIGQILSNYSAKDLTRLTQILAKSANPNNIADSITDLCSDPRWISKIETVFFEYGKEGNPIVDEKRESFIQILSTAHFNAASASALGLISHKNASQDIIRERFDGFALRLAAYWVYRVRCCIAHSKIGEYVMTSDDEPFVALFAEPLLRRVLESTLR